MTTPTSDPRIRVWTRPRSVAVFAFAVIFLAWSLVAIYWPRASVSQAAAEGGKDLEAYRRIVQRVHLGEDYYSAAGAELREGGYATSSVFNWRPPIYAWLLAIFPKPEWGKALLCGLALLALALAFAGGREGGSVGAALLLTLAMAGAFLWCVDGDAFFSQELWAGVLIAVSVGSFAVNCRTGGIAAGLAALWLRELALPFVLIAILLALREKRWREAAMWFLGVGGYAAFLCWHAWQVHEHLTSHELAETSGWIQFGGPVFVVRTSQMNVWLFNLPPWVAAIYLVVSLIGLASWRGPQAFLVGWTVGFFVVAFLVVGKPFNAYWGLLYVALVPWGLIRSPAACRALLEPWRAPGTKAV